MVSVEARPLARPTNTDASKAAKPMVSDKRAKG
jgi:hypothetical protein